MLRKEHSTIPSGMSPVPSRTVSAKKAFNTPLSIRDTERSVLKGFTLRERFQEVRGQWPYHGLQISGNGTAFTVPYICSLHTRKGLPPLPPCMRQLRNASCARKITLVSGTRQTMYRHVSGGSTPTGHQSSRRGGRATPLRPRHMQPRKATILCPCQRPCK